MPLRGYASNAEVIKAMEDLIGKKASISKDLSAGEEWAPYSTPGSWLMYCSKLSNEGFQFSRLQDWLHPLIEELKPDQIPHE
jgi:hypothetical protein